MTIRYKQLNNVFQLQKRFLKLKFVILRVIPMSILGNRDYSLVLCTCQTL